MAISTEKKNLLIMIVPVTIGLILYGVYDYSLRSYLTFFIYTLLGLGSIFVTYKLSINRKALLVFSLVFALTYLSVYLFSLGLGLNTSLFDFCKGVAFTLVSISSCTMVRALALGIESRLLRNIYGAVSYMVLFVFVLLPSILICYFIATSSLISSDIIIALAQTNPTEGTEFIESNFNFKWALALVALMVIYGVNAYFFRALNSFKPHHFIQSISFFWTLAAAVFLALPRMDYLPFSIIKVTSKQLDNFEVYKLQKNERLAKLSELNSLKLSDKLDEKGNLFVLVIGESETRDRMQAYGFKRENTPALVKRLDNPHNILFKNAYSSWPQTVQSLSYALTEANQYHHHESVDAYSIIELARAAGFETYWLSNQRKYGVYETPVTVISSTAHHEIFVNGSSKMEGVFFDEELLNRFPKKFKNKNVLVVVHLMGSHQKYDKRLPSEYLKFEGDDEVLNYYDDTVLYTDYVVDSIYKRASAFENFKAMIYFSDHGENPHVVGGHDPVNLNGMMLRIPLVVYLSDSYVERNEELYSSLKKHQESYFSNDLIFDLTAKIMGISGLPGMKEQYNLASDAYCLDDKSTLTMYGHMHISEIPEHSDSK